MKCKYCKSTINAGDKFCKECGAKVEESKKKAEEPIKEEIHEEIKQENVVKDVKPDKSTAIASLVIGIVSIVFLAGFWLIPLPIVGLVLGLTNKNKCGERTTGIILNIVSIAFAIIVWIFLFIFIFFVGTTIEESGVLDDLDSKFDEVIDYNVENDFERLTDWDIYSLLRSGATAESMTINGEYRVLSISNDYWVFNNDTFYWYKDLNSKEDNYWFGTTNITKGKEGIESLNISQYKKNELLKSVNDDDIYTIVCTPQKIVSDGVDKSETNIPDGTKWTYVWVLVSHDDGIEARALNTTTNKISYFVKYSD